MKKRVPEEPAAESITVVPPKEKILPPPGEACHRGRGAGNHFPGLCWSAANGGMAMEASGRMDPTTTMAALENPLPPGPRGYVGDLLSGIAGVVRPTRPRRTKLGDHRGPARGCAFHRITVNNDLNPYAFLTTLLHEIAHLVTWERHRGSRRIRPHGPQWKAEFGRILAPVVDRGLLPADVSAALARALANPAAATCSDRGLLTALSRYDPPDPSRVPVEQLEDGAAFRVEGGRAFLRGPKLRSRFRCFDAASGREYRIHPLCRVERFEVDTTGMPAAVPRPDPLSSRPVGRQSSHKLRRRA